MKKIIHKFTVLFVMMFLPVIPFANAQQVGYTVATIVISPASGLIPIDIKVIPEKRVSQPGGNYATNLRVRFVDAATQTQVKESTFETNLSGIYSGLDMAGVDQGTYNIYAKGESHLTDKEASVVLDNSNTTVDFSNGEIDKLLAGDVNGTSFGDDIVNAIDLSFLISDIDMFDARTDLNKDGIVNAIDLSIMITNVDETGDT